jgi:hypothetical protein
MLEESFLEHSEYCIFFFQHYLEFENSYNSLAAVHNNDEGYSSNDIVEGVAECAGLSNHAATHNAILIIGGLDVLASLFFGKGILPLFPSEAIFMPPLSPQLEM